MVAHTPRLVIFCRCVLQEKYAAVALLNNLVASDVALGVLSKRLAGPAGERVREMNPEVAGLTSICTDFLLKPFAMASMALSAVRECDDLDRGDEASCLISTLCLD